jgi:hypothetical protein
LIRLQQIALSQQKRNGAARGAYLTFIAIARRGAFFGMMGGCPLGGGKAATACRVLAPWRTATAGVTLAGSIWAGTGSGARALGLMRLAIGFAGTLAGLARGMK